jgi:hypothetical protein
MRPEHIPSAAGEMGTMIDGNMLEWLAIHSENFNIRCNPQQESHTTVARHLLHRERLGEAPRFSSAQARQACLDTARLWEMDIRGNEGSDIHLAAPTLEDCIALARTLLNPPLREAIAA